MKTTQSVYLIKNSLNLYKIGVSSNPTNRLKQIINSSGVSATILSTYLPSKKYADFLEQKLHEVFSSYRQHGEWFKLEQNQIQQIPDLLIKYDSIDIDTNEILNKLEILSNLIKELCLFVSQGNSAEFERGLMLERQREGIVFAKQQGKYKGRKKSIDDEAIREAMKQKGSSYRKVAKALNVSLSTVQRAMK